MISNYLAYHIYYFNDILREKPYLANLHMAHGNNKTIGAEHVGKFSGSQHCEANQNIWLCELCSRAGFVLGCPGSQLKDISALNFRGFKVPTFTNYIKWTTFPHHFQWITATDLGNKRYRQQAPTRRGLCQT